jgi:signal transduction histidine kinase
LLDISRIMTGKLCLDLRAVKLAPLIQAVVNDVRPAADAKNINLKAAFDSDVGRILGDPDRLQQIVWNLLTNAIKFTPKAGDVHLRLERNDSHALITVNDSGQGIATELLPHVFERFRQADSSNTRSSGGLGLGLSIVRQLLNFIEGRSRLKVPVKMRVPPSGSCFRRRVFLKSPTQQKKQNQRMNGIGRQRNTRSVVCASSSSMMNGTLVSLSPRC